MLIITYFGVKKMSDKTHHTRVVVRVEELDKEGKIMNVPSKHVLADFPNDTEEFCDGQKSDDYFNDVIRKCRSL